MPCPVTMTTSPAALSDYMETLDSLPADYTDPWSNCRVTFRWAERRMSDGTPVPVASYGVTGCTRGGFDAAWRVVRQALMNDCQTRYAVEPSVRPPSLAVTPQTITQPVPEPPIQYGGPLIPTVAPQEQTMPIGLITHVPAPSSVPVVSPQPRPISPTGMLQTTPDLLGAVLGGLGGFVAGGPIGAIAGAASGWLGDDLPSIGGETPTSPGALPTGFTPPTFTGPMQCPTGYRWNGTQCVAEGVSGWLQQVIPGGATGTLPAAPPATGTGEVTMGAFGIPAMLPFQVGQINNRPILRCPTGAVLGKDNLCYMKSSIPNRHRKWPRGTRPLLTGGDMKTLRKIRSLENKVKRAWTAAGKPGHRPHRRK